MPTLKDHIKVLETEINATGKRLETETLSASQLVEIGKRMAELSGTLNWLKTCDNMNSRIVGNGAKIIKTIN